VIVDLTDGNFGGELGDATGMITVKVGDDEMVDALDTGGMGGGHDPVGVAVIVAVVTGVDEQGFARGGDIEGGLAALHVDGVDVQGLRGKSHRGGEENEG
jgi:hypothetical protein